MIQNILYIDYLLMKQKKLLGQPNIIHVLYSRIIYVKL